MDEIILNLHMHTSYSDGNASHAEIAEAAMRADLDVVIVTDHNVWVNGPESYYHNNNKRVLLLVGEEIHDQTRVPQKNHLLVFGANRELSNHASDPQKLLEAVRMHKGLSYLAHIIDLAAPSVYQDDLSWESWEVHGYTGIELWNGFSEFKSLLKTKLHVLYYAFNFPRVARGPFPEALQRWDMLLAQGKRVVAIGGSDAHALPGKLGPIRKTVFTYEEHFRAINNHLLLPAPLSEDLVNDRQMVLETLGRGRSFIGYDLPASTKGFRFSAHGKENTVLMGENISAQNGVTLQIRLPQPVECRLIKDGKVVKIWQKRETAAYITTEPGVYRIEAYIHYLGRLRGWIFSNPIYITP